MLATASRTAEGYRAVSYNRERPHQATDMRVPADLLAVTGHLPRTGQVGDRVWLVTFMHYDLGYFDDETCRLEPIDNPFGPKVLPMSSE